MKNLSHVLVLVLVVGVLVLPAAAGAGGARAVLSVPSSPADVNIVVVRPSPVIVTPPVLQPQLVDRPIIDRHRVIVPNPPSLKPLPQPAWVPGSVQSVDAQSIWVPSHFEGPGQILILRNPTTQP